MPLHTEIEFERDIGQHLAAHGWLLAEPGGVGDAHLKQESDRRPVFQKTSDI